MRWSLTEQARAGTDAVVVPAFADQLKHVPAADFVAACGFTGRPGEVLRLPGAAGGPAQVILGFGTAAALDDDTIRHATARLARAVRGFGRLGLALPAPDGRAPGPTAVRAAVEGFLLGGYRFTRHKSAPGGPSGPEHVDLLLPDGGGAAGLTALDEGRRLGAATLLARDLVNEPGQDLTPALFAERAAAVAADSGLRCEVWDEERITAERLGGLLAVARGSLRPPRLVKLTYRPDRPTGRYALIGKGVTFDAGGLSLKPSAEMLTMKADMAGAAAVLGAMSVLAGLNCGTQVDAWLPLTENMPNGDPVRIGDVLRMRGGRTVEVRNADAEGRLILADTLTLAGECRPDAMIDVATLTDAAPIALGRKIAAVMGTDDALVDRVREAAGRAGEPVWPLPLSDRYRWQLESPIADLVNYTIGNRHGTALLAGLFLREFVPPGVPWAHLDIQGTALCDAEDGEWVRGATGFGVRTLAALVREPFASPR
ncbi:leucyl aminopeptidase [Streptomyces sp. H39-S7]|uniref:leucyl aminopeptidase n=1 Tax=Streptomyces sp. H39-S7 TaxID=3004357 RepID=UPI0022AFEEAD|nr:leucyl aminopeptidase [Streptomyces sp. H39-S7]MCZ4121082.1 leucyl aminopeptidase [Streptomyces sp. H39-S7]